MLVRFLFSLFYLFSDESIKRDEYGIIGISSFVSNAARVAASRSVSAFLAQALKIYCS